MNHISVGITQEGIKKYPLHHHNNWEIMHYISGEGYLATATYNIPFQKGSIIIVPPGTIHGSVSENGFVNISISGDFQHLLMFENPILLKDTLQQDGETLARLILNNRYSNADYLSSLCSAYIHFLLQSATCETKLSKSVKEMIAGITEHFCEPDFDVTFLLQQSGYAEDYIRAEFKKITQMTPVQFLTKMRIDHAKRLLEIYGDTNSIAEIAQTCGFHDCVYFSKRFKQFTGIAPDHFRRQSE